MKKPLFTVVVRDTHTRSNVEETTVHTEVEAKNWAKQFRKEYDKECGYRVFTVYHKAA